MSKAGDEKVMLRKHYKDMREKMTAQYKRSLDIEIASRFLCTYEYMQAKTLLVYVSRATEVDTIGIIHGAFANGKRVAVPKCEDNGIMNFYLINSMDDLKKGYAGISEPDVSRCTKLSDFADSICIVPGLSFDPEGYRVGFGGGYYDRFLANYEGISAGLCYTSFVKWDLPREEHDVPVSILVTDRFARHTSEK